MSYSLIVALLAPSAEQSHLQLGQGLQRRGEWEGSLAEYKQALRSRDGYLEGWLHRGVALFSLGRYNEAADAYRRAIALYPSHGTAHYNLSSVLEGAGDLSGAREHYRAALDGADLEASALAREALQRLRN